MFQLFKNFFRKKEQPIEGVSVLFENLESWLAEQANEAAPLQQPVSTLAKKHQLILDEKIVITNNLQVLLQQPLAEKKQLEEKKQVAKLCSDYALTVTTLLATIPEHLPDPEAWQAFYTRYKQIYPSLQQFSSLNDDLGKSFRLLQQSLVSLHNNVQHLHALLNTENVHLINTCRDLIRQLKDMLLTQQYIDLKLQEVFQMKEGERKQREAYALKIEKLKKNEAFQQCAVLADQRNLLSRELEDIQMKLEHSFMLLSKHLKKITEQTPDEQLIKNYLLHPTSTLLDDTSLRIVRVLTVLKERLTKDMTLNNEQQAKLLDVISLLSSDILHQAQTKLAELQRKKTEHERGIRGNILMQEYNDLKYKYDHYDYKMRKHDILLVELHKKHAALPLQAMLEDLQQMLLECTQKKVTIVLSGRI